MKVILKEEQQEKIKLLPFIYKAIVNKNTSLGDNEALPPFGDFGIEYAITKKGFEDADEVINKCIEHGELESKNIDYLISVLSEKIERCKKLEEPIKPQLQKLCENIVNNTFSIPNDTIILKCRLVGKVKSKNDIRVLPESDDNGNIYDFEDVDEVELTNKVILKRRFINSLIQGLSYWLSTEIDDWYDAVKGLNDEIWGLWYEIKHISDYLLYVKKDEINEKNPNLLSYVEVRLGKNGKKTEIDAQGIIFPYLLRDTFRGLFELFSAHGLPSDSKKAMYIIKKADFLVAEPWDLRLGKGIVDMLHNSLTGKYGTWLLFKTNRIPFFFKELCSMETDEFNNVMKNFLLGTKKGRIIASDIDYKIGKNIDYQKFKDRITQKNIDTSVISDGDFSKEELDGYVLQENETDEMMVYHGSPNSFDKFNHKKYLNTGAGSQSFGWGTYVTNDIAVANGYTDTFKYQKWQIDAMGNRTQTADKIYNYLVSNLGYDEENAKRNTTILVNMILKYNNRQRVIDALVEKSKWYMYNSPPYLALVDLKKAFENFSKEDAFLYEVDIPDDNGTNYIEWYEHFPPEMMKRVLRVLFNLKPKYIKAIANSDYTFKSGLYQNIAYPNKEKMIDILCKDENYPVFFGSANYTIEIPSTGGGVYRRLCNLLGSEKAASLFLMQCGFDGIKYPSGTMWNKPDEAAEDAYNYVIFDSNKVKIVNKTGV